MLHQFYPQVPHPYRFELNKDMHIAAAHFIPARSAGKCANIHGHTYVINLTIAGDDLDNTGFLVNFKTLKDVVHKRFDHTLLNEDDQFGSEEESSADTFPTTEVVARTIWQMVQSELDKKQNKPRCVQVLVRETPTSYVVYRPKEGDFR